MMREAPQMTQFCELQSKDWYTVTKNKMTKEKADKTCSVHLLDMNSLVLIMHATASQGAGDHFTTAYSGK